MKTTIGPIVLNTKGYDVLAELEQQEDMYGIKNYLQKRKHAVRFRPKLHLHYRWIYNICKRKRKQCQNGD